MPGAASRSRASSNDCSIVTRRSLGGITKAERVISEFIAPAMMMFFRPDCRSEERGHAGIDGPEPDQVVHREVDEPVAPNRDGRASGDRHEPPRAGQNIPPDASADPVMISGRAPITPTSCDARAEPSMIVATIGRYAIPDFSGLYPHHVLHEERQG